MALSFRWKERTKKVLQIPVDAHFSSTWIKSELTVRRLLKDSPCAFQTMNSYYNCVSDDVPAVVLTRLVSSCLPRTAVRPGRQLLLPR